MIQTSGELAYSHVKGLLHLDESFWCDTGILGCAFRLEPYNGGKPSSMDNYGRLFVEPGYLWDGTSRPIVPGQGKVDAAPSLVHDVIYEAIRSGKAHPSVASEADKLYCAMLKERDVPWWKVAVRRAALFLAGWTARRRSRGPEYPRRVAR